MDTSIEYDPATVAVLDYYDCLTFDAIGTIHEFIIRAYNWHQDYRIRDTFTPFTYGVENETRMLEQDYLNSKMSPNPADLGYNRTIYSHYRASLDKYNVDIVLPETLLPNQVELVNDLSLFYLGDQKTQKSNLSKKTKFVQIPSNPRFIEIYNEVFSGLSTNPISLLGKFQSIRVAASIYNSFNSRYHQASVERMMDAYHGALLV
jgi:hypothetical protein